MAGKAKEDEETSEQLLVSEHDIKKAEKEKQVNVNEVKST